MSSLFTTLVQTLRRVYRRSKIGSLIWAFQQRDKLGCILVHNAQLTTPAILALPLLCKRLKGKLKCPRDMTIVLVHNYRRKPIMERSLRYVGIKNFVVIRARIQGPWHDSAKLMPLLQYLRSESCVTEYILYCDSRDAVLRADPAVAVEYLRDEDCDLLLSSTGYAGGYHFMPEVRRWADCVAQQHGYVNRYLNSGVFVGRTAFVLQVLEAAIQYVTERDLPRSVRKDESLNDSLSGFPAGVGCDQIILRYLHPRFYPRMKIDYRGRLALPR